MTEQELARALVQSGRLTAQQIQEAAQHRGPGRGIAHVLVELGLVSSDEILQIDPRAFEQVPPLPSNPEPARVEPPAPAVPTAGPPIPTPASETPPIPAPPPMSSPSPYSSPAPAQPSGAAQIRMAAIGEAWKLCQQQLGMWIAAMLVTWAIAGGISSVVGNVLQTMPGFAHPTPNPKDPWSVFGPAFFLQIGISSLVQVPVSAFVMGGLLRMALNQLRTGTANVADIFTVTDVFPALVGAFFVVMLASYIGMIFCIIPGLILGGMLMFAVPIVVNQRLSAGEALSLSWNTLKPHALSAALFLFIAGLASASGILLCCIGILFTSPIFYLAVAVVYRDFFPNQVGYEAPPVAPPNFPPPPIPQPPTGVQ
jgi:hypothetical protein